MKRTLAAMLLIFSSAAQSRGLATLEMKLAAATLARQFASTWSDGDGHAYGLACWPDAELVDPSGQISDGRSAIVQTHVDLWRRGKSTASATVQRVRPLSIRLMVVDIRTKVCGFAQLPPGARSDAQGCVWSNLKHVAQKRGKDWKIVASQNTFTRPPN